MKFHINQTYSKISGSLLIEGTGAFFFHPQNLLIAGLNHVLLEGIPGVVVAVNSASAATHDECTGWASPHTQLWQVHFCSLFCQVCGVLPLS